MNVDTAHTVEEFLFDLAWNADPERLSIAPLALVVEVPRRLDHAVRRASEWLGASSPEFVQIVVRFEAEQARSFLNVYFDGLQLQDFSPVDVEELLLAELNVFLRKVVETWLRVTEILEQMVPETPVGVLQLIDLCVGASTSQSMALAESLLGERGRAE